MRVGQTPEIDAFTASRRLAAGEPLQLVDVRQPIEFRRGHIKGSLNVPLSAGRLPLELLRDDAEILVVCASGHRSQLGAGCAVRGIDPSASGRHIGLDTGRSIPSAQR